MLWSAGQERTVRERRNHMTEAFVTVRDAQFWRSDMPRPWYLPEVPPQTLSQYNAALAKFGKLGIVRRGDA
jgi:hypothetical protein